MKKKTDCYLRLYRRRWGFTQKELAFLLGPKSGTVISRLEHQERQPSLKVALACQIIFCVAPIELFPGFFSEIEDEVLARAYDLYERLQGRSSTMAHIKLDFLEEVFERAKSRLTNQEV